MSPGKLSALVTEAIALDRQIRDASERLKELKRLLRTEAELREDERLPTDGGGSALSFAAADGSIARVTFPGPALKDKIDGEGKAIEKIRDVAGRHFDRLFRPVLAYRPIDGFRDEARALLDRAAPKLIDLCSKDSAPAVAFETKEAAE